MLRSFSFFIFTVLLFAFPGLYSQCNPAIPSNAIVISSTQTIGFGGAQLWICSGDSLTTNGGSQTVFLETAAYVAGGGGSNTIYCPAGAKVNMSSGSNIIYYVNPGDILSAGGGPTLNLCTGISYDYTNAPAVGCPKTTCATFDTMTVAACDSFVSPSGKSTWIQSGTYADTLTNVQNCDSFITVMLLVTASPSAAIAYPPASFCAEAPPAFVVLTGDSGGIFSSSAGLILDSLTGTVDVSSSVPGNYQVQYLLDTSGGCAVFTTTANLVIYATPSITQHPITFNGIPGGTAEFTVVATTPNATYQWQIDTSGSFSNLINSGPYMGVSDDTLTLFPLTSGDDLDTFRCIVTNGICADTSDHAVLYITLEPKESEFLTNRFRVYPNPATREISISGLDGREGFSCLIINASSEIVFRGRINGGECGIDVSGFAKGLYVLRIFGISLKSIRFVVGE